tara:strand:- start:2587 stop:3354 length:768 start_codon:yes stop_codon:yes gene_type:complete
MTNKVTLLQDFICTSELRFKFIEKNTPKVGKVLGKWPCIVNFDIKNEFTDRVKSVYENSFENLVFENNTNITWCDWMINKLEEIESPYVMYVIEDVEFFDIFTHNILNQILIDMKKFDVQHLLLGKVQRYMAELKKESRVHSSKDTKLRHFWFHNATNSPYKYNSFTLSAMFKTELMLNTIKFIKVKEKEKSKLKDTMWMLDKFEQTGIKRLGETNVSIPNKLYVGVSLEKLPDERSSGKERKLQKSHEGRWPEN